MRPSFFGKNYSVLSPLAQPVTYGPNFDFGVFNHRAIGSSLDFSSTKLFGAHNSAIFKGIYDTGIDISTIAHGDHDDDDLFELHLEDLHHKDLVESGAQLISSTIPADPSTSATITVGGGSVNGTIDFNGDKDWYKVSLTQGETYRIDLSSGTLPDGNTVVALYNSAGNLIVYDFHGGPGLGSRLTFTANATDDFYIEVQAGYTNVTGDYDLSIDTRSVDSIPNGVDANPVVQVDGAAAKGTLDYVTDQDWYAVNLVAGETYTFTLKGDANGADPLDDPFLYLHAPNGAAIAFNDDISDSNINSRIEYTSPITGTFYLNAGAYTGTNSAAVGDYRLTVKSDGGSGGGGGTPSDPLDALNWGDSQTPSNNITVYFAQAGEVYDDVTSEGWSNKRINDVMAALDHFTDYIDVTFTRVMSPIDATFKLLTDSLGGGVLGYFYPPDQGSFAGIGVFGSDGFGWSNYGLKQGGFGWITLIHEFGHGLGLAHPHDTGGGSTVLDGVSNSGDRGDFDLNQGVFTTMSYLDGWQLAPWGKVTSEYFGYQGTVMAFDIALLQQKYGANTTHNKGNTTYDLPTMNQSGTFWSSIWDTGGRKDTIDGGAATTDVVIDLRPATLMDEEGGGGFLSYMYGIWGGFTIANGVEIERAYGGAHDDTLIGNDLDNVLVGKGGADTIDGKAGDDLIKGGGQADTIKGGTGADRLYGGGGNNRFEFDPGDSLSASLDKIFDFNSGDVIAPGAHTFVGEGAFTAGGSTEIRYVELSGKLRVEIDQDGDGTRDEIILLLNMNAGDDLVSDGTEITLSVAPPKIFNEPETAPADEFVRPDISDFLPHDEWAYIA